MTPDLLAKLEAAAGKATPGPWKSRKSVHGNHYRTVQFDKGPWETAIYTTSEMEAADANFIALCSPDNIQSLIAAVREARERAEPTAQQIENVSRAIGNTVSVVNHITRAKSVIAAYHDANPQPIPSALKSKPSGDV